jgi:hypothetical protein
MSTQPFKSYDRFDQADRARRDGPDLYQHARRCREKANELRGLALHCRQDAVRAAFLDMARTYDGLANDASPVRR